MNFEFRVFVRKIVENINFSTHTAKLMQTMLNHIADPIPTALARMLPTLHAIKVLFYAKYMWVWSLPVT